MSVVKLLTAIGAVCGWKTVVDPTLTTLVNLMKTCATLGYNDLVILTLTLIGSGESVYPSFFPLPPGMVKRIERIWIGAGAETEDLVKIDGVYAVPVTVKRRYVTSAKEMSSIEIEKDILAAAFVYIEYVDYGDKTNKRGYWILKTAGDQTIPYTVIEASETAVKKAEEMITETRGMKEIAITRIAKKLGDKPDPDAYIDDIDYIFRKLTEEKDEEKRKRIREIAEREGYRINTEKEKTFRTEEE